MATGTDLLFEHISGLYLNEKQSDITIIVNDVKLPAHRNILAERCQYFKNMFSSGLLEAASNVIKIQEASSDGFKSVLKWIYTGTADVVSFDNAFEVIRLADMYDIAELVDSAVKYFTALRLRLRLRFSKTHLTVDIVCSILNEAVLLSLHKLIDAVIDFVEDNPNEVLKHETFKLLSTDALKVMLNRGVLAADKNAVFYKVKAWMNANPTRFVDFSDVLKNMPLGTLTPENLATIQSDEFDGLLSIDKAAWDHVLKHGPVHKLKNKNLTAEKYGGSSVTNASGMMFCENGVEDYSHKHSIGDNHGMVFDLGRRFMVNYLEMWLSQDYSYMISVSDDNVTWDRVIDHSKYPCWGYQKLYFKARPARYIRIYGTASADGIMKISYLKALYTTEPFEVDPETTLIIPSHRVLYESRRIQGIFVRDTVIHEVGSRPHDGNIFQLPQPYLLDSLKLHNDGERGCSYNCDIKVSVDQVTWTCVFSEENVSSLRKISFDRQAVVFVKVTGTWNYRNGNSVTISE
uniref:BTB domain-containing protein n=1 Tax=Panagrellus redivivus TaxID=6233 RepID=A0A7E4VGF2_PANRE